mmetsp:Transcript_100216/g.299155  ORF Transcript_100216/g.299155 Transcript_100216/m.299155 type:complete len:96 (+) Transcript_100216:334-621(+)
MQCSRQLSVSVTDVSVTKAAEVAASQSKDGAGAKHGSVFRAYACYLFCRVSHDDLETSMSDIHGVTQCATHLWIGEPRIIPTSFDAILGRRQLRA